MIKCSITIVLFASAFREDVVAPAYVLGLRRQVRMYHPPQSCGRARIYNILAKSYVC